jgi:hypothetical protein
MQRIGEAIRTNFGTNIDTTVLAPYCTGTDRQDERATNCLITTVTVIRELSPFGRNLMQAVYVQ